MTLASLIPRLAGRRVIVLGDVILDEYLIGKATRLSREAPVPVLEFEERQLIPGGAANPAANIVALGSAAAQVGVVGRDAEGEALRAILRERGIAVDPLLTIADRPSTVKTRIMAHMGLRFPQQVARLDKLSREPISAETEARLRAVLRDLITDANALLVSDYHAGLLTPTLVAAALKSANDAGILAAADAQGDFDKYAGFGLVKCNADEARAYLRRDLLSDQDFAAAARDLRRRLGLTLGMVITRGGDGATVALTDDTTAHCPSPAITDVYDTVGAGDTAIAVITLAAAGGAALADAAMLANYASGVVVRRVGNYAPSPDELAQAVAGKNL